MAPSRASGVIDVWDAATFDEELTDILSGESNLVHRYFTTDHEIFLSYDHNRTSERPLLRPQNRYASSFQALTETVSDLVRSKTIRAWHYTRLMDSETEVFRREGIHLSSPATLRTRFDALLAASEITKEIADALYAASPFHAGQLEVRKDKFWMASHPVVTNDDGVTRLLTLWGGEVASFWTKEPHLLAPLAVAGKPRVIEVAVPMAFTRHAYPAGKAIVATYGRTLGCIPSKHDFDLYVTEALPGDAVLAVHTEGDDLFEKIGRGYPEGYSDLDIAWWRELTGEDE